MRLRTVLPLDYKQLLQAADGAEGFVGEFYIHLWSIDELIELNASYEVAKFAPGITLIGTNGGDTGYGFRSARNEFEYVAVPLVGMDVIRVMGGDLVEMFKRLSD